MNLKAKETYRLECRFGSTKPNQPISLAEHFGVQFILIGGVVFVFDEY